MQTSCYKTSMSIQVSIQGKRMQHKYVAEYLATYSVLLILTSHHQYWRKLEEILAAIHRKRSQQKRKLASKNLSYLHLHRPDISIHTLIITNNYYNYFAISLPRSNQQCRHHAIKHQWAFKYLFHGNGCSINTSPNIWRRTAFSYWPATNIIEGNSKKYRLQSIENDLTKKENLLRRTWVTFAPTLSWYISMHPYYN